MPDSDAAAAAAGLPDQWRDLLVAGGLARVATADIAAVELDDWAVRSGWAVLLLDTQDATTEAELITAIATGFAADPDDVADWDDVDELLGDHDVTPAAGLLIGWTGWDNLDEDNESVLAVAIDAFATASRTWLRESIPWAVLLVGEGPLWDLPWLGAAPPPDPDLPDADLSDPGPSDVDLPPDLDAVLEFGDHTAGLALVEEPPATPSG